MNIRVLTPVHQSWYETPIFIIPKKEGTVRFIADYLSINQHLVRNPYPLPKIIETMQQIEGFHYATKLYLNMGYYIISLSPASQDMMAIVTGFGKFRYNRLSMGMCASGDIFQSKVDEVLGDIESNKVYIDDILILIKDCFTNQIEQQRTIFCKLRASGLKVNAPKCNFGLKDIIYLGCVITREGIKLDPNKVQGIMDIG